MFTEFAAQIKHRADVKGTCEAEFSSNLDVAIVLHNPFYKTVQIDGKDVSVRCCKCAVWRAGSASVGEAPFHTKLLNQITEWLKIEVGPSFAHLVVATDRCGKRYSGHRTFRYISEFYSTHKIELWHYMAVPSHFKGPHDGFGKDARKVAPRAERDGKVRLPTIDIYMKWLMENMSIPSKSARGRKKRMPWKFISPDLFVWKLYAPTSKDGDVGNDKNWNSYGIKDCKEYFVFVSRASTDPTSRTVWIRPMPCACDVCLQFQCEDCKHTSDFAGL
jgi:hypothetical protein